MYVLTLGLDFIYTGNFEYPAPTDNENLAELLDDFLRILSIADEWDMPSLKTQVTTEIVEKNHIIERLPNEFSTSELPDFLKMFRNISLNFL
jgi:hypothetical protein